MSADDRIRSSGFAEHFRRHAADDDVLPLFFRADARAALAALPDACVDCCMTSPPYWGQRQYAQRGIGMEATCEDFVAGLLDVFGQLRRVLKPTGSFWLNLGDRYRDKALLGIPWRVALAMIDTQGWILRNEVVWNKVKGSPDNTRDKLRNLHETVFHFVSRRRDYYYDADAVRKPPRQARVVNGAVVSASGVRGVRYRRQIELSTVLSAPEKAAALAALDEMLAALGRGELADFRMVVRGHQRTTHSDARAVSGRAREVRDRGFYFLRYHPGGSKPGDVWDILPEDTHGRGSHFAAYPEDLCRIPILATCPPGGIVLDPFCGTGTTNAVALRLGRKSVGVDVCAEYLEDAARRCQAVWEEDFGLQAAGKI